jgi:hypothetical protein
MSDWPSIGGDRGGLGHYWAGAQMPEPQSALGCVRELAAEGVIVAALVLYAPGVHAASGSDVPVWCYEIMRRPGQEELPAMQMWRLTELRGEIAALGLYAHALDVAHRGERIH